MVFKKTNKLEKHAQSMHPGSKKVECKKRPIQSAECNEQNFAEKVQEMNKQEVNEEISQHEKAEETNEYKENIRRN